MADAEVVFATWQILSSFPWLVDDDEYHLSIRLNHTSLLLSIFTKHGVGEDKQSDVLAAFSECKESGSRQVFVETLMARGVGESTAEGLWAAVKQVDGQKLDVLLKSLAFGNHKKALSLAKQSIAELKAVIRYSETFGVKVRFDCSTGTLNRAIGFPAVGMSTHELSASPG